MKDMSEKKKKRFSWLAVALFFLIVAAVAGTTYFAGMGQMSIPAMPRPSLTAEEAARAMADLTRRAKSMQPTREEKSLIDQMQALHLKETALPDQGEESPVIRRLMDSLKVSLAKSARANPGRHLLLGDLLAERFRRALEALLTARQTKSATQKESLDSLTYQTELTGGAFYRRAVESKMIGADGRLNASRATPEVLFRYRWRIMSGMEPTLGFTTFEKMALSDFTLRFVPPTSKERRLEAVDKLATMDRTYDAVIAKALVHLEAGEKDEARRLIDKAMASGRQDDTIERFSRALRTAQQK